MADDEPQIYDLGHELPLSPRDRARLARLPAARQVLGFLPSQASPERPLEGYISEIQPDARVDPSVAAPYDMLAGISVARIVFDGVDSDPTSLRQHLQSERVRNALLSVPTVERDAPVTLESNAAGERRGELGTHPSHFVGVFAHRTVSGQSLDEDFRPTRLETYLAVRANPHHVSDALYEHMYDAQERGDTFDAYFSRPDTKKMWIRGKQAASNARKDILQRVAAEIGAQIVDPDDINESVTNVFTVTPTERKSIYYYSNVIPVDGNTIVLQRDNDHGGISLQMLRKDLNDVWPDTAQGFPLSNPTSWRAAVEPDAQPMPREYAERYIHHGKSSHVKMASYDQRRQVQPIIDAASRIFLKPISSKMLHPLLVRVQHTPEHWEECAASMRELALEE